MSTVGIVCVHYHPEYATPTLRMVERVVQGKNVLGSVHVANQESAAVALQAAGLGRDAGATKLLRHDNSGQEFGAYQAGLEALLGAADPDWVLVFNDTFATHDNFASPYRERLRGELFHIRAHPTIVGQVEAIARSYRLAGLRTHRWVRSNVFALNRAALQALERRIYVPEFDAAVVETADPAQFFAPVVDAVLAEHLRMWLFTPRTGAVHWYGAAPLEAANVARMARKARSILQEKYLSARLDENATEFADVRQIGVAGRARRTIEDKLFDARKRSAPAARLSGAR